MLRTCNVPLAALWGTFLILLLTLGPPALGAGDEKPAAEPESSGEGAAAPAAAPRPAGVYKLSGATIAWNAEKGRFEAPSDDQLVELSAAFRRMAAEGAGPLAGDSEELEVKTLSNGMTMARLPFRLMSASVVRLDAGGNLVSSCVDGAELHEALGLEIPSEEE